MAAAKNPPSAAKRGAYYKARTKKWLQASGWQVGDLEKVHRVSADVAIKRDQFGSDLIAVSPAAVVFVQVKSGPPGHHCNVSAARREFDRYQFPRSADVHRWIVVWHHRARYPVIHHHYQEGECKVG